MNTYDICVVGGGSGGFGAACAERVHDFDADQLRQQLKKDGIALDLKTGYLDAMPHLTPIPDFS
jgi:cation diffusion facilitator CzcD-associated flavoprotein CzcO